MLKVADREAINFVETFNIATTEQLYNLFYKHMTFRGCRKRLAALTDKKYFKRIRNFLTGEYTYFIDKLPKQIDHMYYRNQLYILLKQRYNLQAFQPEYILGTLRPDAYFEIEVKRNTYIMYYLEVQLSNSFNQKKYEDFYRSGAWKNSLPVFPRVLVVSHKPVRFEPSNIRYYYTDIEFTGLSNLVS